MGVSVIIPMYNNASTAALCLDAIFASSYPVEEVIVVADCPTDDTIAVASRFPAKLIRLSSNMGAANARNVGAAAASEDLLFYTDGDVSVEPETIARGVEALRLRADLAAVVGLYAKPARAGDFVSEYKHLAYHHVHMTASDDSGIFIGNCGLIRKNVLFGLGGFDTNNAAMRHLEDVDLGIRMRQQGHKILLHKEMLVVHHRRFTLPGLLWSDLARRAIPWSLLILGHRSLKLDNCTSFSDLVSVLSTIAIVGALGFGLATGGPSGPAEGLILLSYSLLIGIVDRQLLSFLFRERGVWFAFKAFPMRMLYYLCAAVGLAAGAILFAARAVSTSLRKGTNERAASSNLAELARIEAHDRSSPPASLS